MANLSTKFVDDKRRFSVSALWSMANQQDPEVEDDLTEAQKKLQSLKTKISNQSKKNFLLEKDVRYLDSRIALLIAHASASEAEEIEKNLEDVEAPVGNFPDERKRQLYGNLFFILQTEPKNIAKLAKLVNLTEMDSLLQTVMFTLYGNQYESREEYLLLTVFQLVLKEEFEENEIGTLMRANTPASRMMTTYTRRGPGQSYLKKCLSKCFQKIYEEDLNLEINPLKVYEQMINDIEVETGQTCDLPRGVTQEVASNNAKVQAIIEPRLKKIREISEMFLQVILGSLDIVPFGIRWISKQIRNLAKRRFPEEAAISVSSLIGSFYMLRFLNPAVVTPSAYMLIDKQLSPQAKRTCTIIAKMLQNLTNRPNYSREEYMLPLNGFIEDNKEKIHKFFNDLCEVEDFYEQLEIEQYIALSKKEITLNITLNEIYSTHELIYKNIDALAPKDADHLKIIINELGAAPKQLPRQENKPTVIQLFSRWEVPIEEELKALKIQQITPNDALYMETKKLIVEILRSLPPLKTKPLSLSSVIEAACKTKSNVPLMKKGTKVAESIRKLESEGVISASDNYAQLTSEVGQELMDLEKLREKVQHEIESLEGVYQIIKEHSNYLKMQLESYRAYLQNVRMKSGSVSSSTTSQSGHYLGPFKFTHTQLEKDGVLIESDVPENRRNNIYFNFISPIPGTFIIALHYKGREKPILELDLKLDDLLEKQMANDHTLDLEYVQLNVNKTLHLLNKTFLRK